MVLSKDKCLPGSPATYVRYAFRFREGDRVIVTVCADCGRVLYGGVHSG